MEPTWEREGIKLYLGDCLEVLPTLGKVDAVVTDPPYGVGFNGKNTKHTQRLSDGYIGGDDEQIGPKAVAECVKIATVTLVTPGVRCAFDYPKPDEIGGVYCPSGAGLGRWGFIGIHPILYYGKCPYLKNRMGHRPNSFSSFSTQEPNGHPCPKPIEWMLWLVEKASPFTEETILDPFMGSGTTGVACVKLGRKFIGIEKEPKYFEIAVKRIERALSEERSSLFRNKDDRVSATEKSKGLFTGVDE